MKVTIELSDIEYANLMAYCAALELTPRNLVLKNKHNLSIDSGAMEAEEYTEKATLRFNEAFNKALTKRGKTLKPEFENEYLIK